MVGKLSECFQEFVAEFQFAFYRNCSTYYMYIMDGICWGIVAGFMLKICRENS